MNKRIKELAQQAQIDGDSIHYYNPEFAKKFAELIVKECAKIAEAYEPDEKSDDITYASQDIRALISG